MNATFDTTYEEAANTLTHGFGALLSLIAGIALIVMAALSGNPYQIVSAAVYSISLVLLYTASTLYHGARGGQAKRRLEIFDHCAIFVLIAGTYTPFMLVTLRGPLGWTLFGIVWGLASLGILFKLIFATRFQIVSTLAYIAMGWLVVVAAGPMISALSATTIGLLVAGGLAYTLGTLFYHNTRIPYSHAIWHLFVLAGSALHFLAVASQVV
jgi:hemolysin III